MNRDLFIDKLTVLLKKWNAELDKLEAEAQKAQLDARTQINRRIQDLRSRKLEAEERLAEVKQAGEGAWDQFKEGAQDTLEDVRNALETARAEA